MHISQYIINHVYIIQQNPINVKTSLTTCMTGDLLPVGLVHFLLHVHVVLVVLLVHADDEVPLLLRVLLERRVEALGVLHIRVLSRAVVGLEGGEAQHADAHVGPGVVVDQELPPPFFLEATKREKR